MNNYQWQRIIYFTAYMIAFMAIGGLYGIGAVFLTAGALLAFHLASKTSDKEIAEEETW